MSHDRKVVRSSIQRAAIAIVRREMHDYDMLSQTPRIRVDRSNIHAIDEVVDLTHGTRSCAHGRALHEPCVECERTVEDCKVYRDVASMRLKELLAKLGG